MVTQARSRTAKMEQMSRARLSDARSFARQKCASYRSNRNGFPRSKAPSLNGEKRAARPPSVNVSRIDGSSQQRPQSNRPNGCQVRQARDEPHEDSDPECKRKRVGSLGVPTICVPNTEAESDDVGMEQWQTDQISPAVTGYQIVRCRSRDSRAAAIQLGHPNARHGTSALPRISHARSPGHRRAIGGGVATMRRPIGRLDVLWRSVPTLSPAQK